MFDISKIRPKSILGPVKAPKIFRSVCLSDNDKWQAFFNRNYVLDNLVFVFVEVMFEIQFVKWRSCCQKFW